MHYVRQDVIPKLQTKFENLFKSTLSTMNFKQDNQQNHTAQPPFTCSKLTIETLEHDVKYVQS